MRKLDKKFNRIYGKQEIESTTLMLNIILLNYLYFIFFTLMIKKYESIIRIAFIIMIIKLLQKNPLPFPILSIKEGFTPITEGKDFSILYSPSENKPYRFIVSPALLLFWFHKLVFNKWVNCRADRNYWRFKGKEKFSNLILDSNYA